MSLASLRRAFDQAERDRLDALALYRATVEYYQTRRSARTRANAYADVLNAYRGAQRATRRRERAAAAFQQAQRPTRRLKPLPVSLRPAGTEFELTATTRGGSPRHDRKFSDPRVLHLKIRVVLERAMTRETALALLSEAIQTRRLPSGIQIEGIDWAKGASGEQQSDDPVNVQLRRFYRAIQQSQTRFAEVAP